MPYKRYRANWLVVISESSISLLTFCLLILLIIGRKELISLVVTMELSISSFGSLEFLLQFEFCY